MHCIYFSRFVFDEFYLGNLPLVLRTTGYGPKLLDMIGSLQQHTTEEPYTPYQETTPPLQAEEAGPPT
jgi:hypothetical protein